MKNFRLSLAVAFALVAGLLASPVAAQQTLTNPTIIGHMKSAPEGIAPVLSTCGTGPTVQAGSTDAAGRIVTGSALTTCTITFQRTYTQPPVCVVAAEVATQPTYTVSATAIIISVSIASTAYHYNCTAIGSGS